MDVKKILDLSNTHALVHLASRQKSIEQTSTGKDFFHSTVLLAGRLRAMEEIPGSHRAQTSSHPSTLQLAHLLLSQVAGKPRDVQVRRALWHILLHWLWCRRVRHRLSHWLGHRLCHRCCWLIIQPGTLGSMGWLLCRIHNTLHSITLSASCRVKQIHTGCQSAYNCYSAEHFKVDLPDNQQSKT